MYKRLLKLETLIKQKSHFLFGPRSTGKSTLIRHLFNESNAIFFDLLERDTYKRLLQKPSLLAEVDQKKIIVIDEIQKIPSLLDEVHRLIQKNNTTFLLTGSSARKLKHGSSNLLAGRAWETFLYPLTSKEITNFNLEQYLTRGGLPQAYDSEFWNKELGAYISLYLREEVAQEALTRNIDAFAEFLDLVAKSNGQEINYQNFASDCGVSINTIKNYFQILEDTLIAFPVRAFTKTTKRKAITRSKYYMFDTGVVNALNGSHNISPESALFGQAFEHFLILEIRAAITYLELNYKLSYWRSTTQFEVDLILEKKWAIEFKSTNNIQDKHLKGLRAMKEEGLIENYLIVSLDQIERTTNDGIQCMYWEKFLDKIWTKKI